MKVATPFLKFMHLPENTFKILDNTLAESIADEDDSTIPSIYHLFLR